jgi:serine O-acetyltransferase
MLFNYLKDEIKAFKERDPAARGAVEIVLCYPGFKAILLHRLAHWLWNRHFKLLARLVSEFSRWLTGVEIHPGARIGKRFFIDHGMGIVIGETTDIADDVSIYQGVTLGGTSWTKGKRHPTIEPHVVIGTHAAVLGPVTVGRESRIGSGSVVVHDVPPHSTVVGIPGRVVHRREPTDDEDRKQDDLAHGTLPDPYGDALRDLDDRLRRLEEVRR